jgi:hypothetical protein
VVAGGATVVGVAALVLVAEVTFPFFKSGVVLGDLSEVLVLA